MKARKFECGRAQFSKDFYKVGNKNYLTDFDSIQVGDTIYNTENELFLNYTFEDNEAIPKRYFEVKWSMTNSIRKQISGEDKPSPQTRAMLAQTQMINAFLDVLGKEPVNLYYVVQTEGAYPYYVYDVSYDFMGDVVYTYVTKLEDEDEFIDGFK